MKIENLILKSSKDFHRNITYYHFECSETMGEESESIMVAWNKFLEALSRWIENNEEME